MPFDLSTAEPVDAPISQGFDLNTAKPVIEDDEVIYDSPNNRVVKSPSGMGADEFDYSSARQLDNKEDSQFFGFTQTAKDSALNTAKGYVSAIIDSGVNLAAGDTASIEKRLKVVNQGLSEGKDRDFINWLFANKDGIGFEAEKEKLQKKLADNLKLRKDIGAVKSGMGLDKKEGGTVSEFAFDLGAGGQSLIMSIGVSGIAKSPAMAAGLFAMIQKSSDYQEARDKGFSVEVSDKVSNLTAAATGAIELVGVETMGRVFKNSHVFKRMFNGYVTNAVEEGSQELATILIKNKYDITDTNFDEGLKEVAYSAFIGGLIGAPVSVMFGERELSAKEQEVADAVYNQAISDETLKSQVAPVIDKEIEQEFSGVKDNKEAYTKFQKLHDDFISGKDIDVTVYGLESQVDAKADQIKAQEGKDILPVPKRPETLGEFIRKQGGLKLDGDTKQFTKKENEALKGVAKKTGKLSLDEARQMAVDEGFLTDADASDMTISDINDLITALENEGAGKDVVRARDMTALMERRNVEEYNAQKDEFNYLQYSTKREIKSFTQAFREGVSAAKKDVKTAQTAIIKALDASKLPAADKAKFIKTIKNVQSFKQLEKKAPDIEARVSNLLDRNIKNTIRTAIKKKISSAKKRKDMAVDGLANIKKLEQDLKASGVLGAGKKDTPVSEFKDALDRVEALFAEGKAKKAIGDAQKKERMVQRIDELSEDTIPLNLRDKIGGPLEKITALDKIKNLYIGAANYTQRIGLLKNQMDVIFDVMDGGAEYEGSNSRVFKQTMDKSYHRFLQLKEAVARDVKDLQDEIKLDELSYRRIGVYATAQQEGGAKHLKKMGLTQEDVAGLTLNENELQMYNLMREKLDSLQPLLKEVMKSAYNKDFTKVKDYFPFMTDFKAMNDVEVDKMFGEDVFLISDNKADFAKKDVKKGFTKERTGGKQKIRIDAMDVFLNHVENATYLIEMGQDIKELGNLAISDEYRELAGDWGQEVVVDWIDLMARKGRAAGHISGLDTMRVHTGAAVLGLKLSSALIQPTALMDGAAFIGGSFVARGINNVTDKNWRVFMKKNMPEIRDRVGDDPNYIDMGGTGFLAKQRQAGFWALQKLDLLAASAVASGAYTKSVEERGGVVDFNNPDQIALEYAQLAVRRSQSSAFAKDSAPIISQGKLTGNVSVDKLILQFQSFMFNRWSMIEHDFWREGVKKGKTARAANIATWLILANISEKYIRHLGKEFIALLTGAELEDEEDPLLEKAVLQGLSNVPFVSSAVGMLEYGSIPVPSLSLAQSVGNSLTYANRSKSDEKKLKHYSQAALLGIGTAAGISGTLQAKQIIQKATSDSDAKKTKGKSLGNAY